MLSERPFQWAAMRLPFTRRWIAHLDDRGLQIAKKPRDADGYAMFPPDIAPPGDHGMAPFPVDRDAGIAAARAADRP